MRGHDEKNTSSNRGIFLDLLDHIAKLDSILHDHLESATVAKHTSKTIHNKLLDCMYQVYFDELKNDINNLNFVAIQADETTDVSCVSQFVIILRFVKDHKPIRIEVLLVCLAF